MTTIALESIESLRLPQLRALFTEVTGETTRSPNKTYLIRRIRERLAAQAADARQEQQAIEEMADRAATNKEPASEAEAAQEPASMLVSAEKPASAEPAPVIAEEPASATQEEPENAEEPASATQEPESAEEPASITSEPEPAEDEIEALATEADLAELLAEEEATDADGANGASAEGAAEAKLSKLSVAELQRKYLEVVGRPTSSSHKRYLIWKIREAQKGRVPVGPRSQRMHAGGADAEMKILPLRMEESLVERLDEARKRLGLKSRMDLFRKALGAYMAQNGESELAAALAAE